MEKQEFVHFCVKTYTACGTHKDYYLKFQHTDKLTNDIDKTTCPKCIKNIKIGKGYENS